MIFSTMDALSLDESKCASCGKEDDNGSLKRCNACKLVKYCNAECQKTHRPAHKKLCKKRAKELYDEKLFADPPPPDDCPICLLTMPLNANESVFKYCCGKLICGGCILTFSQKARQLGNTDIRNICPFCREPMRDRTSEEEVAMYNKFMERGDGYAFLNMGTAYLRGSLGLEKDIHKAVDLWIKAGEHGCSDGYQNVGVAYNNGQVGLDTDWKKAQKYYELAAIGGNMTARWRLGDFAILADQEERAVKHYMIAAKGGYKDALDAVRREVADGNATKEQYEEALRAYQKSMDDRKSESRELYSEMKTSSVAEVVRKQKGNDAWLAGL